MTLREEALAAYRAQTPRDRLREFQEAVARMEQLIASHRPPLFWRIVDRLLPF
jgi:hypothetical protein